MPAACLRAWAQDPERSVARQLRRLARELGISRAAVEAVRERLQRAGIDAHEDAGPYLFAIRAGLLREQRLRDDLERVRSCLVSVRERLAEAEHRAAGELRILERLREGLEERHALLHALLAAPPRRERARPLRSEQRPE